MNKDVLEGKWKEIRGDVKKWWGKITDDDLDQINGNMDKLAGILQQRYGYAKETAQKEIDLRMKEFEARNPKPLYAKQSK